MSPLFNYIRARTGVLVLIFLLIVAHVIFNSSLDQLRGKSFDLYQKLTPRTVSSDSVVVVGVDDETIGVEGRWPWPRNRIADLVEAIQSAGVSALGVDVLFSEPDNSTGGQARDARLAGAIAATPTILATSIGDFPGSTTPDTNVGWAVVGNGDADALAWLPGVIASTPTIRAGATGLGIVRSVSDSDGVVRSVPLVWASRAADQLSLWPAFSLELARVHLSESGYALRIRPSGYEALKLGDTVIPLSNGGAIWLWEQANPIPRVSALDVMAGQSVDILKGRIAILSVNALGVDKFHTTPTVAARSGSEVHAVLTNQNSRRQIPVRTGNRQADGTDLVSGFGPAVADRIVLFRQPDLVVAGRRNCAVSSAIAWRVSGVSVFCAPVRTGSAGHWPGRGGIGRGLQPVPQNLTPGAASCRASFRSFCRQMWLPCSARRAVI